MSNIDLMAEHLSLVNWILALLPIIVVALLMVIRKWSGAKAGALAWLISVSVVLIRFGGNPVTVASGSAKGLWETVFILAIIWGAMSIYGLIHGMGGFPVIARTFNRVTGGDRLLQILIIGMVFPAWLQGVLGFGTPVAVTAPLLVGLGFNPVLAVVVPALGHSWTVTFGSLGSSFWVLQRFTDLAEGPLAFWSALLFVPTTIMIFFFGTYFYSRMVYGSGWKEIRRGWFAWLSLAIVQAAALLFFSVTVSPSISGFLAGFVGLAWGAILPRVPFYRVDTNKSQVTPGSDQGSGKEMSFHLAFLPYYIVVLVVLVIYLSPLAAQWTGLPDLKSILEAERFRVGFPWPEIRTGMGLVNPSVAQYSPLKILTMPGTLIFLSLGLSTAFYASIGIFKKEVVNIVLDRLSKSAVPATLTLMTLSMMAGVMMEHGMTTLVAVGTAIAAGSTYPFFANYVGQLGAFITGSNTASNILFGAFQRDTALALGINPYIIAGLQTVGGAIGNAHCPLNIVLATSTVGLSGREGEVISRTLTAGLVMGFILGLLGLALTMVFA
ncbi:MAG: L-lactate permease [Bacillota bacterium]